MAPTKRRYGFTIIEIVVVAAILALLVAIVLKVAPAMIQTSRASRTKQTIRMVTESIEAFKQSAGCYPLAVPQDAWNDWDVFTAGVNWNGTWTDYFANASGHPAYAGFDGNTPTNIHMLVFQLEQVPESNAILQRIKDSVKLDTQKKPDTNDVFWDRASEPCELMHPLGGPARTVYQVQDAWGTPLRYWSSDTLNWAKTAGWNSDIQTLLAERLERANWGFFIESAGNDRSFGWWRRGPAAEHAPDQHTADNIYSVDQ